jgi:NAD/NADP transhydrogenase beta subunit
MDFATFLIKASYFVAAFLFIVGLKRMSSPKTARGGVVWAGWGMVLATVVTFFWPGLENLCSSSSPSRSAAASPGGRARRSP